MQEKWIEVHITYDIVEAEIIKDLLESGGVPVVLRSLKVGPYPVNVGKMGEVKILVKKEDEETAAQIIQSGRDNSDPL